MWFLRTCDDFYDNKKTEFYFVILFIDGAVDFFFDRRNHIGILFLFCMLIALLTLLTSFESRDKVSELIQLRHLWTSLQSAIIVSCCCRKSLHVLRNLIGVLVATSRSATASSTIQAMWCHAASIARLAIVTVPKTMLDSLLRLKRRLRTTSTGKKCRLSSSFVKRCTLYPRKEFELP